MANRFAPCHLCLPGLAVSIIFAIAGCNLRPGPTDPPAVEKLEPTALPSQHAVVAALEHAYETRDPGRFEALLGEGFVFIPGSSGNWDRVEEVRIHRRMFDPSGIPPGDAPLPPEVWLQSVDATLTQVSKFSERLDLYASPTNPAGLDPAQWHVSEAIYSTQVLFQLQGDIDFQVDGRAAFVVMVERVGLGVSARSALYRWEDLGSVVKKSQRTANVEATWADVKELYR